MQKTVIIINGVGGVGKDTICSIVAEKFRVKTVSSIDPIKAIASLGGWSPADKTLAGRKLLADLKMAFIEYNDLPTRHVLSEYQKFLADENDFLFVHIREAEEIQKFVQYVTINCKTLLVRSQRVNVEHFGNKADDCVNEYPYDYVYNNEKDISELSADFIQFFMKTICLNLED